MSAPMRTTKMTKTILNSRLLLAPMAALLLTATAYGAAPGISASNNTFNLVASDAYLNQPDGNAVYSWGYGCLNTTGITFLPAAISGSCPNMQVPGPTLIVTEGTTASPV